MTKQIVFIDTETGGLDPLKHSILSFGIAAWCNGEILHGTETFVREDVLCVTPGALNVNEFDLTTLDAYGYSPDKAVKLFEIALDRYVVCGHEILLAGHNVGFDVNFMKRLYRLAGKQWPVFISHRTIDTCSLLETLKVMGLAEGMGNGFSAALEYFDIVQSDKDKHTALSDAVCSAQLFNKIIDHLGIE